MTELPLDANLARLELNAKGYRPDPLLDRVADLIDAGDHEALAKLPAKALDLGSIHRDFRDQYRAAVAAGAITDRYTDQ